MQKSVTFSERLKFVRNHAGLTQDDLAARSGVSARSISDYERGLSEPSLEMLSKLSRALKQPIDYLVTGQITELGASSTDAFVLRDAPSREVSSDMRARIHSHVDAVIDECAGRPEKLAWTLVELQRRFPASPGVGASSQQTGVPREEIDRVTAEALRRKKNMAGHPAAPPDKAKQ